MTVYDLAAASVLYLSAVGTLAAHLAWRHLWETRRVRDLMILMTEQSLKDRVALSELSRLLADQSRQQSALLRAMAELFDEHAAMSRAMSAATANHPRKDILHD